MSATPNPPVGLTTGLASLAHARSEPGLPDQPRSGLRHVRKTPPQHVTAAPGHPIAETITPAYTMVFTPGGSPDGSDGTWDTRWRRAYTVEAICELGGSPLLIWADTFEANEAALAAATEHIHDFSTGSDGMLKWHGSTPYGWEDALAGDHVYLDGHRSVIDVYKAGGRHIVSDTYTSEHGTSTTWYAHLPGMMMAAARLTVANLFAAATLS